MSKIVDYAKNKVIFNEGDLGDCMYYISGNENAVVAIYSNYGTNKEVLLAELRLFDYFGEMALIGGNIRSATAVAKSDVSLQVIEEADFKEFASTHPRLLKEIVQNSARRLRLLTRDYTDACVTLSKYVDAKEKGEAIPKEILAKMEKFA